MPLYEYQCQDCGKVFEVIQKYSDAPITSHQGCGGAVEKLLSAPSFQFKGTGWYATDYGKSGSKLDKGGKTEASPDAAPKTETKASESTKPAATPPPAVKT